MSSTALGRIDRVNKKVMEDPRSREMNPDSMPFDTKQFIWGGFKSVVWR